MKVISIIKRIPYPLRIAILTVLLSKLLIFGIGYTVNFIANGPAAPLSILMSQFYHWDSVHYVDIAKNGYVNQGEARNNIAFFPLYPLLIRLTTLDFAYINLSALLISNVSSVIAAYYLFKLAKLDYNDDTAKKAVLYLSIFPLSFFLSSIYTEGLFLALAIASFYYARTKTWYLAGLLSLFAALTRMGGLILLPALLVEYFHQNQWSLRKIQANIVWANLALPGFLIYLGINNQVAGSPFAFMEVQLTQWHQTLNPFVGFLDAWQRATASAFPQNVYGTAQITFASLGLLAVVAGFILRFRPSYNIYMLLTWLLTVSVSWWNSIPRYVLAMFPMFILLASQKQGKTRTYIITIFSTIILCLFTALFALGKFVF